MKSHYFFTARMPRSAMLLGAFLLYSCACSAQANFWTIFGNSTITPSGCNINNQMSCTTPPASLTFSNVPALTNHFGVTPASSSDYFKNSVYDVSGELLFSVASDGIYAPDGTEIYPFNPSSLTTPPSYTFTCNSGSGSVTEQLFPQFTGAGSEIVIFPAPGKCNAYYVVFWCGINNGGGYYFGSSSTPLPLILRCIEVDINTPAFGNSSAPNAPGSWYNISQDAALDPPYCTASTIVNNCFPNNYGGPPYFSLNVVANSLNTDFSRDVYTVSVDQLQIPGGTYIYPTRILRWNFPATGVLPVYYLPTAATPTPPPPVNVFTVTVTLPPTTFPTPTVTVWPPLDTKTKIFNFPNTTGTFDPVIAYISST